MMGLETFFCAACSLWAVVNAASPIHMELKGLGPSTIELFSPKVSLDELRFVISNGQEYYVELSGDQAMLFSDYVKAHGWDYDKYTDMGSHFDEKSEVWLSSRIPERTGEVFTLYFPRTNKFADTLFVGLTPLMSGIDFVGLMGRLGPVQGSGHTSDTYTKVIGLAFRGGGPGKILQAKPLNFDFSVRDRDDLSARVRELQEGWSIRRLVPITFRYSEINGAAIIVANEESVIEYLYCYAKAASNWVMSEIRCKQCDLNESGGIEYRSQIVQHHSSFENPELIALPDMDGNGASELLLISDVKTVLFSLELEYVGGSNHKPVINSIKSMYFGM